MELDTRDVVARAIYTEIREGRASPHGGVWLDCSYLPPETIQHVVNKVYGGWTFLGVNMLDYGLDIRRVAVEVGPAAHYFMGGIRVNDKWETDIPGLYAAGEVVGGMHGANRLAGNALIDTQVSAVRAGEHAAERARKLTRPTLDRKQIVKEKERVFLILKRKGGYPVSKAKSKIQNLMWEKVGIIRSGETLKTALRELKKIRNRLVPRISLKSDSKIYNREWVEVLELENMLDVAEMTTKAALLREESRGAHYREDIASTRREWLKNIIIGQKHRKMKLIIVPVVRAQGRFDG